MTNTSGRIDCVESIARDGAERAFEGFRSDIDPETKGGAERVVNAGDVVTELDRAAQKAVRTAIETRYPEDAFVGEEGDVRKSVPDDGFAWVVDPIDGTYNFVRGLPMWSTAVALVSDGEPIAAATVAPAMENTYAAEPGSVTRNGRRITVSDRTDPETFAVAYTVVPGLGERGAYSDGVAAMLRRFGEVRRIGSLQIVLGLVASGALDGVVTPAVVSPWDSVGGVHLVREAGGVVTDVHGEQWTEGSTGLVASNGAAHDALRTIGRRMAEQN
jgi:myo-inositol-1(or 4)-monophosphatase